jgi:hypothetical protein
LDEKSPFKVKELELEAEAHSDSFQNRCHSRIPPILGYETPDKVL